LEKRKGGGGAGQWAAVEPGREQRPSEAAAELGREQRRRRRRI